MSEFKFNEAQLMYIEMIARLGAMTQAIEYLENLQDKQHTTILQTPIENFKEQDRAQEAQANGIARGMGMDKFHELDKWYERDEEENDK